MKREETVREKTHASVRFKIGGRNLMAVCGLMMTLVLAEEKATASLLYNLPFDDGASPTLANYGTIGGTATAVTVDSVTPSPSTDTHHPSSPYSESFPMASGTGNQSGGRVDLPDASQLRLTSAGDKLTVALWLKWLGPDGHSDARQGLVSTLPGAQNTGWGFSVLNDGSLFFGAAGVFNATSTLKIQSGVWNHVAATWDVGNDFGLRFYVNGADAGGGSIYLSTTPAAANTNPIQLGTLDGRFLPVNGLMDEVRLYDQVLTQEEIQALPEPGAAVLLTSGGVLLWGWRRRFSVS